MASTLFESDAITESASLLVKGLFIHLTIDSNEIHNKTIYVYAQKKSAFLNNKRSKRNVAILGNKAK